MLTPPTDNLYKFLAIAGLVLIVVSESVILGARERLLTQMDQVYADTLVLSATGEMDDLEWSDLAARICAVEDEVDRLLRVKSAEKHSPEVVKRSTAKVAELRARRDILLERSRSYRVAKAKRDANETVLQRIEVQGNLYGWLAVGGGAFGGLMAGLGFFLWFVRVQRFQDMLLVNEAADIRPKTKGRRRIRAGRG